MSAALSFSTNIEREELQINLPLMSLSARGVWDWRGWGALLSTPTHVGP